MRRLAVLGLVVGCSSEDPVVLVSVWPEEVVLDPIAWKESTFEWATVGLLNETYFNLQVADIHLEGVGAQNLELSSGGSTLELAIRDTARLQVRVRPPPGGDRTLWTTADFEAALTFTVIGYGVIDPNTGEADQTQRSELDLSVPIRYGLNCDMDGDGYDARACAGSDCNDDYAAIRPGIAEVCDGVDNNCLNGVDEGCP